MRITHQRITIIRERRPVRNLNEELQWLGNSLGLFNLRDKDKSCFRIFIELLKAAKVDKPLTSDEIAVNLDLDNTELSKSIKNKIQEEFEDILYMLKFGDLGHDIFRSWYVDGRKVYHLVVDEKNPKKGIVDIRPVDAAKIRKVKEVIKKKDPITGANIIEGQNEYFIYQEKPGQQNSGIKLTKDSVVYTTSAAHPCFCERLSGCGPGIRQPLPAAFSR